MPCDYTVIHQYCHVIYTFLVLIKKLRKSHFWIEGSYVRVTLMSHMI